MKATQSVEKSILSRIYGGGRGSVSSPSDFLDLGNRKSIDMALARLVQKGIIRRVGRGIYGFPQKSRLIGELSPQPEKVAKALARRSVQKLLPSGAYSANLLGLTDQVPARIEYLTDGPARKAVIGKLPVVLKQSTPARLATAGRVSGTVAQALRFLRKNQVDEAVVEKLRQRLSAAEKAQLLKDIRLVPSWVGDVFRQIGQAS